MARHARAHSAYRPSRPGSTGLQNSPPTLPSRAQTTRAWTAPRPHYVSGVMAKYAATARQADDGAVTNIKPPTVV